MGNERPEFLGREAARHGPGYQVYRIPWPQPQLRNRKRDDDAHGPLQGSRGEVPDGGGRGDDALLRWAQMMREGKETLATPSTE